MQHLVPTEEDRSQVFRKRTSSSLGLQRTVTMDSTPEEWKSVFPMPSVFNVPPLPYSNSNYANPNPSSELGPLIFKPKPNTTTILYSSPSFLPPPVNPLPHLSLHRFLATTSPESAPLPSTCSSIASFLSPDDEYSNPLSNAHNWLEFLQFPQANSILIFFPTGEISNQVGFLELVLQGSSIHVKVSSQQSILRHRISRISAIPVSNFRGNGPVTIGYLLASTMSSVHWFTVKVGKSGSDPDISLHNVVDRNFVTSCVVHACWNPHILEESVVLLENGHLYLFDLEPFLNSSNAVAYIKGTKLKVHWRPISNINGSGRWLSCEFSWNHRLLVIARSDAVFLVDFSSKLCKLTCLVKIEMYASIEKEQFHVLSKVGSDSFHFVLVSDHLLLLCDVRKPLMPVLQWAHGLFEPTYAHVYRLSELRSYSNCDTYNWSSDSGFCIIVGSFWNCEFSTFCYGPSLPTPMGSVASKVTEFKKYFCAWQLPSALLLSGDDGTCLVRDEFSKDALPEWIDWQHKKEIVLGFGVVNKELSTLNSEAHEFEFGGFTVIRLMSSGKLELQRFCASWGPVKQVEESHRTFKYKDHLLYSPVEEYRFTKRYKYLKLDYLHGYLDGSLDQVLDAKMKKPSKDVRGKKPFSPEFHEILCKKLHDCGYDQLRPSPPAISILLNDVSFAESIHEVVLRRLWSGLPMELLQLAFSNYPEFSEVLVDQKKVSLEFAAVPDGLSQLPPFLLRRPVKWSKKVQPGDTLVGPVLPLPLLLGLHEYRNGCPNSQLARFSVEAELSRNCDEVMQAVCEMTDDQVIGGLFSYQQAAAKDSSLDHKSVYKDDRFDTFIFKLSEKKQESTSEVGLELFDDLICPANLKFNACSMKFEQEEMESYNLLKSQLGGWQNSFDLYADFRSQIPSSVELN